MLNNIYLHKIKEKGTVYLRPTHLCARSNKMAYVILNKLGTVSFLNRVRIYPLQVLKSRRRVYRGRSPTFSSIKYRHFKNIISHFLLPITFTVRPRKYGLIMRCFFRGLGPKLCACASSSSARNSVSDLRRHARCNIE